MKITELRTNHFIEPLGMSLQKPIFSWVTQSQVDKKQAAARVTVRDNRGSLVFDSGKLKEISSLGFEAPIKLSPRTRYTWEVTVWGDKGGKACASSFFETAKEEEPWKGKWIAAGLNDKECHPLLAKDFSLPQEVVSARAYVCGLGIYELYLNGEKANEEYLLPGYHCYDSALEYQTFDITPFLKAGENTIGLSLGPGWYKGDIIFDRFHDLYGDTMQAICELHILLKDGSEQVVVSDESWKSYPSPVTFSNIYDGEAFDASLLTPGWSCPGCKAPAYKVVLSKASAPLVPRLGPKIVKKHAFSPIEVIHTKKGETVLDFGQNMTGWVEFEAREPKGSEILLSYGEVLQDGCFYRDNLRTAKCEYRYKSDGTLRHVRPHFTFYGFRYVKVEGVSSLDPKDFTAFHIRSDIDPIGRIETGNAKVNRLFQNAMWGQFDNFLDVPTDCPQRDERLGWTGDAAIISSTACKNLYMPAFFHHFVENIRREQAHFGGSVPFFVPTPKVKKPGDFFWLNGNDKGCAIWSDVAAMMPWAIYENFGDRFLLQREYPVMKAWAERVRKDDRADGDRGLWLRGMQLGDWLALDREDGDTQNPFGATDLAYTATAFYYYSSSLTYKAAKALGYEEDAKEYEALSEKIKKAFLKEYFTEDGSLKIHETQTACVISLYFGLYPAGGAKKVTDTLLRLLKENNMHLNTGFCGTPFLCLALTENGASEAAYTLFLNEDFPSWLYEVNLGATTVWERWNSLLPDGSISGTGMNSLNHYAYGSIADWMYRCVCGLNPSEKAPGYKKAVIRPQPHPRLGFARLSMDSASGRYEVRWHYEGEQLHYQVTVPFDCEAELILPDGRSYSLEAGSYTF